MLDKIGLGFEIILSHHFTKLETHCTKTILGLKRLFRPSSQKTSLLILIEIHLFLTTAAITLLPIPAVKQWGA